MNNAAGAAVSASEFSRLMARAAPFEPLPRIAVGVSGGADSLALMLLVDGWARRRGGAAVALTVDHRLRRGSGAEAREVGRILARHGIRHHVLTRHGPAPGSNVQAAARAARYALLGDWCRRRGVLHLALAHHLEDQAETLLLRLGRGSGADGLACMPMVAERQDVRLIRPCIAVPRARLRAVLHPRRVAWIEDPSNHDTSFARVRVRAALPALALQGLHAERLAVTAGNMGRARAALEQQTAGLLARAAIVHPAGYCLLDAAALAAAPRDVSLRALSRVLMCIGGNVYPPRLNRLERLHDRLTGGGLGGGATLAGCQIAPAAAGLLITRERRAASERLPVGPGMDVVWDRRFRIRLGGRRGTGRTPYTIAALGAEGWSRLVREHPDLVDPVARGVPPTARLTLPALRDRRGIIAVPHLGYRRSGRGSSALTIKITEFSPPQPMMGAVFAVV